MMSLLRPPETFIVSLADNTPNHFFFKCVFGLCSKIVLYNRILKLCVYDTVSWINAVPAMMSYEEL